MDATITFREARRDDVGAVVALLADDALGATREIGGAEPAAVYVAAFDAIDADMNNTLLVGERGGEVIACVQVTLSASLTRSGATRATLEGVRVRGDLRGSGAGEALVREAIALARERGASIVQLTSDKRRPDAIRFYERLGFEASHEGLKLSLT